MGTMAYAQDARAKNPETKPQEERQKEDGVPVPPETTSVTKHDLTLGGQVIHYTATAGNLLIRDDQDRPEASMFYVAYTQDGADAGTRPVTFFFNGGPGAATIWLHMGSFGPVRVVTRSPEASGPAPYKWVPNEYSLLDKSDLVFIDAPLCGFSRAVAKGTTKDFAGTDQDIRAFRRFIERYITANQRWTSPKFLFGESYGTTRAAGLAAALQNDGVPFNGIILLSSILNYGIRNVGYDAEFVGYLPSYAAIAYYYKKVKVSGSLADWVQQAREFARGPYAEALAKGDRLSSGELEAVAAQASAFTGLRVGYLRETRLRVAPGRFRKELLRDDDRTLGRYDARFMGWDPDAAGETPGFDPSDTGISGAFVGAFHDYIQHELKYMSQEPYYTSGPGVNQAWDFKHEGPGEGRNKQAMPDTALDLADAMRKNPSLHVFSANGYFDLATPFFVTEYDLNHMSLPKQLVGNVEFGYYPAGHMVYLNVDALKGMKADLGRFYSDLLHK
jgi:carboxypeptidase C (cathepsin A)